MVGDGAHDAGDVVDHHKGDQGVQKAIAASEEPAEPSSDGGKHELDAVPEFFHYLSPFYLLAICNHIVVCPTSFELLVQIECPITIGGVTCTCAYA